MRYGFFLILVFAFPAQAEDWRWTATALTLIDCLQSQEIVENPEYTEKNPILGRHPSKAALNRLCAFSLLLQHGIGQSLPKRSRSQWYLTFVVVEAWAVGHNYKTGLGLGINF